MPGPLYFGITPAYAGKSSASSSSVHRSRDHPRVCGEKLPSLVMRWMSRGSPPRMRGKDCACHCLLLPYGITPAYAGKSYAQRNFAHNSWDHPRVCGEKAQAVQQTATRTGSPPRMRGKGGGKIALKNPSGITPAYAGKRLCYPLCLSPLWDHPRVCGEKEVELVSVVIVVGSPPRMRGKAGSGSYPRPLPGDHPRVCGEKICEGLGCKGALGSPPRMRGKVHGAAHVQKILGITPAYAGKSVRVAPVFVAHRDHPRVCGEKLQNPRFPRRGSGSPPRMRGKARLKLWDMLKRGITPAYAGKSPLCQRSERF